jgi:hypothetical protein
MKLLKILQVFSAVVSCGICLEVANDATAAETAPGVWQKHEYSFQYTGFTTAYSCDGLASKLRILLVAAGARADAKSIAAGCVRGFGVPDKLPAARLTFYTLAPAGTSDAAPSISGVWRSVLIRDRSPREVGLGDCELIEQFRDRVLPMFTTRSVENRMTCIPNQLSGSAINLKFEVLAAPQAEKK